MNWKAIGPQPLRNLAKGRFGEVLKIDELTDEEIAEEMNAYDRCREHHTKGKHDAETM